jgi:AraC-like DNA-binding protein
VTIENRNRKTHDWDTAHRAVADVYFPHELTALSSPDDLELSLRTVDLGPVVLGRLNWGTDVSIECDYPGAYEINIPLTGRLHSTAEHGEVVSEAGSGTVFRADTPAKITQWTADCQVIGIKFDADHLEREADRMRASPLRGRLRLPQQVDMTNNDESNWFTLVRALTANLREPDSLLNNPLVAPQLASAVASAFILAVTPLDDNTTAVRPRIVKRVLDAFEDDPARIWSPADMAEVAGASVRRVQEGFNQYVGMSPTAALLDIRLNRADHDLRSSTRHETVSDIAARWGFSNASRFAAAYRKRYLLRPSDVHRSLSR